MHIGWIGFIQYEQMYKFKGGVVMFALEKMKKELEKIEIEDKLVELRAMNEYLENLLFKLEAENLIGEELGKLLNEK